MRPLGLLIIWHVDREKNAWTIMKNGLFGYYQNGVDYLNEYIRTHEGWRPERAHSDTTLAFEKGEYRIELSLVETTGVDLSKETYLETENAEAVND